MVTSVSVRRRYTCIFFSSYDQVFDILLKHPSPKFQSRFPIYINIESFRKAKLQHWIPLCVTSEDFGRGIVTNCRLPCLEEEVYGVEGRAWLGPSPLAW